MKANLSELEKRIFDAAMEALPLIKERKRKIKTEARYIHFPFTCDGCIDTLVYDRAVHKFIRIEYYKGVKNALSVEGMSDCAGYFDKEDIQKFVIEL